MTSTLLRNVLTRSKPFTFQSTLYSPHKLHSSFTNKLQCHPNVYNLVKRDFFNHSYYQSNQNQSKTHHQTRFQSPQLRTVFKNFSTQQGDWFGPIALNGQWQSIWKPLLFTVVVAGGIVLLLNSEQYRKWKREQLIKQQLALRKPATSSIEKWWRSFDDATKTLLFLGGINALVFFAWQIPGLNAFMTTHFAHTPIYTHLSPLLLCNFSHVAPWHFLFNMFALYSFGSSLHHAVGREHLIGLYLAGGLSSSLASHLFKLATRSAAPSLGASGSVFAIVAASVYLNPDSRLAFIFLPFVSFPASALLPVLIGFDLIGAFLAATKIYRSRLDHAAHLGGALFGYLYIDHLVKSYKARAKQQQSRW